MVILAAWVFALEYSLYLVTGDLPDKIIKVAAGLMMLFFFRYHRDALPNREKQLILLYYALLGTALIPSFFVGDPVIGVTQWMKVAWMTLVLPVLLLDRRTSQEPGRLLLSVYMAVGLFFAIQAILAFFAVLFDVVDLSVTIPLDRHPGQFATTMGLLGYADAFKYSGDINWLRPQAWFLEPSLLGSFLLLPAFVSLGRFMQSRRVQHLVAFLLLFGALFLTVSLAAYLGFIVALSFLLLGRPLYRRLTSLFRPAGRAYPFLITAGFLAIAVSLMGILNAFADINSSQLEQGSALVVDLYGRDPNSDSGNLFREVAKTGLYVNTFTSNPMGIGLGATLGENEVLAPNGFLFWAIAGGVPALLVLVLLFGHIFYAICHPLLISDNVLHRCIGASLLGHAVHNLSYGNWLAPYFLVHLVVVCMVARQAKPALGPAAVVGAQAHQLAPAVGMSGNSSSY